MQISTPFKEDFTFFLIYLCSKETFADNILYVKESSDDRYLYSAEIRSVSENVAIILMKVRLT